MPRHLNTNGPPPPHGYREASDEPVVAAEFVRMLLVVLVGIGWLALDEATITAVAAAVAALLSILASWWTRRRVVPVTPLPGPDEPVDRPR